MRFRVDWRETDGTTKTDRFDTPHASTQVFEGGRAMLLLLDDAYKVAGGVQYSFVSRICWGAALPEAEGQDSCRSERLGAT